MWFLVAIALSNVVILFVTRSFQTEPMMNRVQRSTRNQMIVYAGTATQIANGEGESGVKAFLTRLRDLEPPREVDLVAEDGNVWYGTTDDIEDSRELIGRTLTSRTAEVDFSSEDRSIGAAPVDFPDGRKFVLVLQWERTGPPSLFFGSWIGLFRLSGLLLTGLALCYLLALNLTSPIRKIREATRGLAAGDLKTRVLPQIGRRRDELADLARDFDVMAERLESLVTSQARLTQDISHELRSPLARMNVALEIAKQKAGPDSLPLLARIEKESDRLNEMIGRILILAKLEGGADDLEHEWIDLADLVSDVSEDADFEAKAKGKSVKMSKIDDCRVVGSDNLLRSAVENVLRNAVRYTVDGSDVDVSLDANADKAVIKIADHGGGVPEEELANLFRPFYRVGEARERRTGGIGLGLAIADRAIQAHKGTITARNKNGGLEVEIILNRSDRTKA
ncbi:MAG: HAMP domain-containing protein [Chloracidobacterium sp.]|nr:HAMP domain-containing protein [Chloracidobacterium sp.]